MEKIIKILEKKFCDLTLREEFLNLIPKAQSIKGKYDRLYFITILKFCSAKDAFKRIKR